MPQIRFDDSSMSVGSRSPSRNEVLPDLAEDVKGEILQGFITADDFDDVMGDNKYVSILRIYIQTIVASVYEVRRVLIHLS